MSNSNYWRLTNMAEEKKYAFMGRGWSFPPAFSKQSRGTVMLSDEANVARSVRLCVQTRLGERMFHPNLGTEIDDFAFVRNYNTIDQQRLKRMIEYAIVENEPRVDVDDISIEHNLADESIEISIAYTIKSSNTQFNMVFPFYYEGGLRF